MVTHTSRLTDYLHRKEQGLLSHTSDYTSVGCLSEGDEGNKRENNQKHSFIGGIYNQLRRGYDSKL